MHTARKNKLAILAALAATTVSALAVPPDPETVMDGLTTSMEGWGAALIGLVVGMAVIGLAIKYIRRVGR